MIQTIAHGIYGIYEAQGPGAARESAESGYVGVKDVNYEREIYFFEDGSGIVFEGSAVMRPPGMKSLPVGSLG